MPCLWRYQLSETHDALMATVVDDLLISESRYEIGRRTVEFLRSK